MQLTAKLILSLSINFRQIYNFFPFKSAFLCKIVPLDVTIYE